MKVLRISLHSFILVLINLAAIIIGFLIFKLHKTANQITIQIPVAVVLSILLFILWNWLVKHLSFKRLYLEKLEDFLLIYVASLLWAPVIFVPIHYITQGYLTSIGNILALLFFQLPTNGLAVYTAKLAIKNNTRL